MSVRFLYMPSGFTGYLKEYARLGGQKTRE